MKRVRIVGICFVAAVAIGAVAAAGASAEAPEYGRCVKGVAHEGGFATSGCIGIDTEDNDGIYSWVPGVVKGGFTESSTTGSTIETVKGTKVTCKTLSAAGEFVGTKEFVLPTGMKLNGCTSGGIPYNTEGAAAEEVVTNPLTGHLRIEKFGAEPSKDKLVNELVPTSGGLYATIKAGSFRVEWRPESTGGVLNTLVVNKMLKSSSNKYTSTQGEEKPSGYEPEEGVTVPAGFESSFGGSPFEEFAWTITIAQTNEEAVEASTVN
jgi:hypothetical protein